MTTLKQFRSLHWWIFLYYWYRLSFIFHNLVLYWWLIVTILLKSSELERTLHLYCNNCFVLDEVKYQKWTVIYLEKCRNYLTIMNKKMYTKLKHFVAGANWTILYMGSKSGYGTKIIFLDGGKELETFLQSHRHNCFFLYIHLRWMWNQIWSLYQFSEWTSFQI